MTPTATVPRPRASACCARRRSATCATHCPWCGRYRTRGRHLITRSSGASSTSWSGTCPDVEFVVSTSGPASRATATCGIKCPRRRYDVLLHMQPRCEPARRPAMVPARSASASTARAREGQWLFTNRHILAKTNQHVLTPCSASPRRSDSPPGRCAGTFRCPRTRWLRPPRDPGRCTDDGGEPMLQPRAAQLEPRTLCGAGRPCGRAAPVAGDRLRRPDRPRAQLRRADRGRDASPRQNPVGRDTLPGLLATLGRATLLGVAGPGPAHMATAVGTPVLGLYAATNPERSGPVLQPPVVREPLCRCRAPPARPQSPATSRGPPRSSGRA